MLGVIIVGIVIVVAFIEIKLSNDLNSFLVEKREFDMKLVQPQEQITLTYSVANKSRLPIMYINYFECLPEQCVVLEDDDFIKRYVRSNIGGFRVKYHFYLLPKHQFKGKVHFAITKRGVYKIGKCYLETGDFLGFNSKVENRERFQDIIVMPALSEDQEALQTLGGYIGDISVRRFILEDPILTMGFRDYTGSESFRDIAWNQLAKVGKLQVKQYDHTVDTRVIVVLNMEGHNKNELEECLSLTRTVIEQLEAKYIPYQFISNGDAHSAPEGLGKSHLTPILINLSKSRLICYYGFKSLIDRCVSSKNDDCSYILISKPLSEEEEDYLHRLQLVTTTPICLLEGKVSDDE